MTTYLVTDKATGTDAARDFSSVWAELSRHSVRMDKLEARHQ